MSIPEKTEESFYCNFVGKKRDLPLLFRQNTFSSLDDFSTSLQIHAVFPRVKEILYERYW